MDDIITPELRDGPAAMGSGSTPIRHGRSLQDAVDRAEKDAIEAVLREVDGNKERAAELLGLSATTLWRKMKRLDIQGP